MHTTLAPGYTRMPTHSLQLCRDFGSWLYFCADLEAGNEECSDVATIRLVGGETDTEGRVEVCIGGLWGTVCNDLWTEENMKVVCNQLDIPFNSKCIHFMYSSIS